MMFSSPIPRAVQPRFNEGANVHGVSVRDSRNNSKSWQKNNVVKNQSSSDGGVLANLQRKVAQLRKRQTGYTLQTNLSHPFKIYQPTNFASFATGIAFLGSDGTPTVCKIDSTVPTNLAASPPTVNPNTDAWRFWAVRSGMVEIRPYYTLLTLNELPLGWTSADNWWWKYTINTNTDGVDPVFHSQEFDDSTTATNNPPLILGGNNGISFSFWIEIVPDTSDADLPSASIKARSFGFGGAAFPDSNPNIIPVGIINKIGSDGEPVVTQEIFDHVAHARNNDRWFPVSITAFPVGGMNFRGIYDVQANTFSPEDLNNQIIYPNDIIVLNNFSPFDDTNIFNGMMNFIGGSQPRVWTDPIENVNSYWTLIFYALNQNALA